MGEELWSRRTFIACVLALSLCLGIAVFSLYRSHPSDPYRLDVVVPGEQHFYLKATSPHQRQEWLMALGSVKTCLNSEKASQLLLEEDYKKRKLCELRLYCDLLVQQVHSIKSAVVDNPIPDVQKMDESTSLLGQTCDTLIQTLEECIQINTPPSPLGYKCSLGPGTTNSLSDNRLPWQNNPVNPDFIIKSVRQDEPQEDSLLKDNGEEFRSSAVNGISDTKENMGNSQDTGKELSLKEKTFFGRLKARYYRWRPARVASVSGDMRVSSFAHIRLNDDGSIPTMTFLESCTTLTLIFDLMGSTAFAPVKMDVNGNIRKLTQKYETDPGRFETLHRIVKSELDKGTTDVPNSATDALLWLKRGITFLREFIQCFQEGETDLSECANKAYAKSLKKYHGWVVRGVFSIAAKAAPLREDFTKSLHGDFEDTDSPVFERQLQTEVTSYLAGIDRCLKSLNLLFESNGIDREDVVTK